MLSNIGRQAADSSVRIISAGWRLKTPWAMPISEATVQSSTRSSSLAHEAKASAMSVEQSIRIRFMGALVFREGVALRLSLTCFCR